MQVSIFMFSLIKAIILIKLNKMKMSSQDTKQHNSLFCIDLFLTFSIMKRTPRDKLVRF